jgi:uncharacterized protein
MKLLNYISLFLFLMAPISKAAEKSIKALILTGGCCHNYEFQSQAITQAIAKVASVEWTILQDPSRGTRPKETNTYEKADWAAPYDIVIHNECFADTDDAAYLQKITKAHAGPSGKPAIVIHCAMHTYRAAKVDDWREFLGVTSRRHDHMSKYPVKPADAGHPIMKGFPELWTTPSDELYIIEKLWPNAKPLATSVSEADGKTYPVAWINDYKGTRVFGTTFGHSDETFRDPVFQNLLANAFLWATKAK